jgi:hypothetical protein
MGHVSSPGLQSGLSRKSFVPKVLHVSVISPVHAARFALLFLRYTLSHFIVSRSCHEIPGGCRCSIWNSCGVRGHNKRDTLCLRWRTVRFIKLLVICFVDVSDIFISITSKYSQYYLLKEYQAVSDIQSCRRKVVSVEALCFAISLCSTSNSSETNQCYLLSSPYFLSASAFSSLVLYTPPPVPVPFCLRLGAHLRFIAAATEKSQSPKSIAVGTRRPKCG